MVDTPVHGAIWVRQLAEKLQQDGHSIRPLLAEVGLDLRWLKSDSTVLAFDKTIRFFELAAVLTQDDCLGFQFGQTRDARDAGLIGYVGLASPTVMDAIRNLDRFGRVFTDAVGLQLDALEHSGTLIWQFRFSPSAPQRQLTEFSVANVVRSLRSLTGRNFVPQRVAFRHPRNANPGIFNSFFGCEVEFAAPDTLLQFKRADLHLPLQTADDRLLGVLKSNCAEVLSRLATAAPSLVEKVERLIVDRLAAGGASLDAVSAELGMSRRTLSRKLAESSTSFNAILDNLRRELALAYLKDSSFSLIEIAFLLGYTEVASFCTAFKRLTGATPGQMRRSASLLQLAGPGSAPKGDV